MVNQGSGQSSVAGCQWAVLSYILFVILSEANEVEGPLFPPRTVFYYTVSHRANSMLPRLLKQFVAVLLGNLLYFFVLMSHLPPAARHTPYQLDWGLVIDLWVCLVVYGLIELTVRFWRRRNAGTNR